MPGPEEAEAAKTWPLAIQLERRALQSGLCWEGRGPGDVTQPLRPERTLSPESPEDSTGRYCPGEAGRAISAEQHGRAVSPRGRARLGPSRHPGARDSFCRRRRLRGRPWTSGLHVPRTPFSRWGDPGAPWSHARPPASSGLRSDAPAWRGEGECVRETSRPCPAPRGRRALSSLEPRGLRKTPGCHRGRRPWPHLRPDSGRSRPCAETKVLCPGCQAASCSPGLPPG